MLVLQHLVYINFTYIVNVTDPTNVYPLSLHDALPICVFCGGEGLPARLVDDFSSLVDAELVNLYGPTEGCIDERDRKSTRLNSSHVEISYAVFCLKKKKY